MLCLFLKGQLLVIVWQNVLRRDVALDMALQATVDVFSVPNNFTFVILSTKIKLN